MILHPLRCVKLLHQFRVTLSFLCQVYALKFLMKGCFIVALHCWSSARCVRWTLLSLCLLYLAVRFTNISNIWISSEKMPRIKPKAAESTIKYAFLSRKGGTSFSIPVYEKVLFLSSFDFESGFFCQTRPNHPPPIFFLSFFPSPWTKFQHNDNSRSQKQPKQSIGNLVLSSSRINKFEIV